MHDISLAKYGSLTSFLIIKYLNTAGLSLSLRSKMFLSCYTKQI